MKYTRTLMAAAAALMIAGCGPTMPVKATRLEPAKTLH